MNNFFNCGNFLKSLPQSREKMSNLELQTRALFVSDVDERVTSAAVGLLGRYVARLEQMSRLLGWTTGYGTEGENPACITATFLYFTFHDEYTWSERRCAFTRHLKN